MEKTSGQLSASGLAQALTSVPSRGASDTLWSGDLAKLMGPPSTCPTVERWLGSYREAVNVLGEEPYLRHSAF